jgi:hypothetical protein
MVTFGRTSRTSPRAASSLITDGAARTATSLTIHSGSTPATRRCACRRASRASTPRWEPAACARSAPSTAASRRGRVVSLTPLRSASFQVTSIGSDTWIKADPRALRALGIPAASVQRVAGHWFKAPWRQPSGLAGFSLDSLAGGVGRNDTPLQPKVETVTLDGRKVLVLSQRNGAKLFVAATGAAFPLRTDEKAGHVQFSEYGVDFHITAPADVVDLNAAG